MNVPHITFYRKWDVELVPISDQKHNELQC